MKANTSRTGRLAFDAAAELYAKGRPSVPANLVGDLIRRTGLVPSARVLEIGAGTGQLTRPLRAVGLSVVALEPGGRLRAVPAAELGADPEVVIRGDLFEEYDGTGCPFAAVWSANAFHWVDPAVSYRRAAEVLAPGGSLILIWNHPLLPGTLQRALNDGVFAARAPDSIREPDTVLASLERGAAEGRAELVASGCFESVWSEWRAEPLSLDVDGFVALTLSYGHVAELDDAARAEFGADIRRVVAEQAGEAAELELTNHIYTCVARRA